MSNEVKLTRGLKNRHIQLIALGGTIGTSLFFGSAKLILTTGPSIILLFLLSGITIYFIMRMLGEMLLSNLKYSSLQDVIYEHFGKKASFIIGWAYWSFWIITCAQDCIGISGYFQYWSKSIPKLVPMLIILVILIIFNLKNVSVFGEIEFWMSIIKVIMIIFFIILGVVVVFFGKFFLSNHNEFSIGYLTTGGGFFATGIKGLLASLPLTFLSFTGIEIVCISNLEVKNPKVVLPKAIRTLPLRLLLFYAGSMFVMVCIEPWTKIDPSVSPFITFFAKVGIPFGAAIINLVLISAAVSAINSCLFSSSRMSFNLVQNKNAPKFFAKLNKNKAPKNSILFIAAITITFVIITSFYEKIIDAFLMITSLCSIIYLVVAVMIVFSYLKFLKTPKHKESSFKAPFGIYGAIFSLVYLAVVLFSFLMTKNGLTGLSIGAGLFLFLFLIYGKVSSKSQ